MSRDSSATYVHLTSSRLADLFEEFTRPPTSTVFGPSGAATGGAQQTAAAGGVNGPGNANVSGAIAQGALADGSGMVAMPGHYLPFEEIALPPHLMPINPEDEDDVVPDMHAAFGINRALNQGAVAAGGAGVVSAGGVNPGGEASHAGVAREPVWRDLGLEGLVADTRRLDLSGGEVSMGTRREGRRTGLLLLR
jgi:hypothetical protein